MASDSHGRSLLVLFTRLRVWFWGFIGDMIGEALYEVMAAIPFRRFFKYPAPGQSRLNSDIEQEVIKLEGQIKGVKRECSGPGVLQRIHLNAAGIDIGSREHYVAVPEDRDSQHVRVFGCMTPDLHEMARWLKGCGIETVAMESTGVYWVPVAQILESYGFEVVLVDTRHVRHVPGRKTDVADCQWLQELHTFGLLSGAFIPEERVRVLRSYWRQRGSLVESCSRQIQLMQKALEQMNVQLHKVLSDISGVSGQRIIRAILSGERDPFVLARMRDRKVKASEDTVAKALTGDYRQEHLFALRQAVELYDFYQQKIAECDQEIERHLAVFESKADPADLRDKPVKKNKRGRRKNESWIDLRAHLYRITGVDLTRIDGFDSLTVQTIVSECGIDLSKFPTEKRFVSWLGLCPNNRITGGRVHDSRTRKVHSRAAKVLRLAAQSLHGSKSALGAFYRRLHARLGPSKAITATARKLAILYYRMLKFGMEYVDRGQQAYEEHYRDKVLKNLKTQALTAGYKLVPIQ